jgi:hypothetical protein
MSAHTEYVRQIHQHCSPFWGEFSEELHWTKGPPENHLENFSVLKFSPSKEQNLFTYVTCGLSEADEKEPIECFLLSPFPDASLCELLTIVAWYHRRRASLGWGHTVNFGRPWLPESSCDHGLFSTPYLDGPELEWLDRGSSRVQFLWLIPITAAEREFKKQHGLEALESKFETAGFHFADPARKSVI